MTTAPLVKFSFMLRRLMLGKLPRFWEPSYAGTRAPHIVWERSLKPAAKLLVASLFTRNRCRGVPSFVKGGFAAWRVRHHLKSLALYACSIHGGNEAHRGPARDGVSPTRMGPTYIAQWRLTSHGVLIAIHGRRHPPTAGLIGTLSLVMIPRYDVPLPGEGLVLNGAVLAGRMLLAAIIGAIRLGGTAPVTSPSPSRADGDRASLRGND